MSLTEHQIPRCFIHVNKVYENINDKVEPFLTLNEKLGGDGGGEERGAKAFVNRQSSKQSMC